MEEESKWQAFTGNEDELPQDLSADELKKIVKALEHDTNESVDTDVSEINIQPSDTSSDNEDLQHHQVKAALDEYDTLVAEIEKLKQQKKVLERELALSKRTSEEINRLALKEANQLLTKAKRNADMILRESMAYVKGLTSNIDDYKQGAIDFRKKVIKLSDEVLETIDDSELFSLIREENAMKEKGHNNNF